MGKSFQKMKMKTIFYKSMFETILKDVGCVWSVMSDEKIVLQDENNFVKKKTIDLVFCVYVLCGKNARYLINCQ